MATPTADCPTLVYDLLLPVTINCHSKSTLSHQENRILGEIKDQIEQILALVFENYKPLDESSASGIIDAFRPTTRLSAPVLEPAVSFTHFFMTSYHLKYKIIYAIISRLLQRKYQ